MRVHTPSSNTSLFPAATLHKRWLFSDRPEILSANNCSWTSPVRLQHNSIFSAWQTHSHLTKLSRCQSPSNPWFSTTLLQVSLQPISQAHPISQKEYYSSLISSASNNSKRLWQTVKKTPTPQILTTSSLGTSLADSFASFFTGKISKLRLSLATLLHHLRTNPVLLPLPLISRFSLLPQNPKSTRSCTTVQTSNLIQIPSPTCFSKNVIRTCSHNHQYCQPLSHFRPVSSHSQGISYLTTA